MKIIALLLLTSIISFSAYAQDNTLTDDLIRLRDNPGPVLNETAKSLKPADFETEDDTRENGDDQVTYNKMALTSAAGAAGEVSLFAGISWLRQNYTSLTSRAATPDVVIGELDDTRLNNIMRTVDKSFFAYSGIGLRGGAQIVLDVDMVALNSNIASQTAAKKILNSPLAKALDSQDKYKAATETVDITTDNVGVSRAESIQRMTIASQPSFQPQVLRLKTIGSRENLLLELQKIRDTGASVKTVTFRGLTPKLALSGAGATSALQIFIAGRAAADFLQAGYYSTYSVSGQNNDFMANNCERTDDPSQPFINCDVSGLLKVLSTSEVFLGAVFLDEDQL